MSLGMILECCGCERMYFQLNDNVDHWEVDRSASLPGEVVGKYGTRTSYWPPPTVRSRPRWVTDIERVDDDLGNLLHEMYTAINADLCVLAAVGARTVFDRASELLGVDPALDFKDKLAALREKGKVSVDEETTLNVLVDAGNAAAHRGWRPEADELSTMMDVVESFLHRSFIVGGGIAKLRTSVPPRAKRRRP